jgi:hypothetical protein
MRWLSVLVAVFCCVCKCYCEFIKRFRTKKPAQSTHLNNPTALSIYCRYLFDTMRSQARPRYGTVKNNLLPSTSLNEYCFSEDYSIMKLCMKLVCEACNHVLKYYAFSGINGAKLPQSRRSDPSHQVSRSSQCGFYCRNGCVRG